MRRPRSGAGTAEGHSLDAALAEAQKKVAVLKQTARDVKAQLKQAKRAAKQAKKAVRRARKAEAQNGGEGTDTDVTPAEAAVTKTRTKVTVKTKPVKKVKAAKIVMDKTVTAAAKPAKIGSRTKRMKRAKKRASKARPGRSATARTPLASESPATESVLPDASDAADWNQDEWAADVSANSE